MSAVERPVDDAEVVVERDGSVVVVALNRPHRRNALSAAMIDALGDVFDELAERDEVAAVVVYGVGGFFCSGLDVKEIDLSDAPRAAWVRAHLALSRIAAPVIAAVTGGAINAGAALALGCDLLVAGNAAYVQIMEAAMGVTAPLNAAWLAERYPASVGRQLVLSGRPFSGPELHRLGVAYEVHPDEEVVTQARALARTLADYPKHGAVRAKGSLDRARAADPTFTARINAVLAEERGTP